MITFSLDTNCLIDVAEDRPNAAAIRVLADAHRKGSADVAVVAISASERQKNGRALTSFGQFKARLTELDLGHLGVLKPMFYWDVTYWDWAYWVESEMEALERRIHAILFSSIQFEWKDFCGARGRDADNAAGDTRWRNAKCDVQALWSHVYHARDVFVTADEGFHAASKVLSLVALGAGRIAYPQEVLNLVRERTITS